MNPLEILRISWEAVNRNRIRSILTMLGIIIGVGAVIIMVSISAGTEASIQQSIVGLGANLIYVQPSFTRSRPAPGQAPVGGLVYDDATAIQDQVTGVTAVVVEQSSGQTVKYGKIVLSDITIDGTSPGFPDVRDMKVASGRFFIQNDVDHKQKVAVLGSDLATQLFGTDNPIGQTISVGNARLIVIGVLAQKGSVGSVNYDMRVYTPITVVFQEFEPERFARILGNRVGTIYVKVDPTKDINNTILQVQLLLVQRHKVTLDTADFTITTQQDVIATRESTTAAFRSLLAWVAGVSLIVGGIGIMNIMLVSVTERTREIGIRQAVGAAPDDILWQFLTEAVLLSVAGGLIGLVLGFGGSWAYGQFGGMPTVIVPSSILLAFGSAAAVGIFFGFYPAYKASQLDPIEALRYE